MKPYTVKSLIVVLVIPAALLYSERALGNPLFSQQASTASESNLELIRPSENGSRFIRVGSGEEFLAWGVNYDHDHSGRLLEDYWLEEWATVVEDFQEIKELGANVVRIHLQIAKFMKSPTLSDEASLAQLARLLSLAEETELYLDITGLGCYHKKDVPDWYDALKEHERWQVQVLFWKAVAQTCAESPAVFCYDLMNEPILPGPKKKENEWLAGEFGGKHFVQRISLDLGARTRKEVAKAWVDRLVAEIREYDDRHMITVGVIPWIHTFPKAKPLFYSPEVSENLDFVSVHFYPKKGEIHRAITALAAYNIGKPLVVEEMFPLKCSVDELDAFIDASRRTTNGWIGFYWGKTISEYADEESPTVASAITKSWLAYFQKKSHEILRFQRHEKP